MWRFLPYGLGPGDNVSHAGNAGHRAKFISEVLYIYNAANPINDCKVDRQLQRSLETVIRMQKRYDRLK